jgi:hypothetical protein
MTFAEWYNFNFVENKIMDFLGDIYVKVFRKKSFKHEDMSLCGLMRISDAVKLVGNLELMKVNFHSELRDGEPNYKALCALVCMNEDQPTLFK